MFNKAKHATTEDNAKTLVAPETRPASSSGPSSRPSLSVIGSQTQVEGDINSDEDLTIEGRVSGVITCKQHTVTLGANGYVNGDVFAHTLHVSGEINGNLVVLNRATIHKGAQVSGTIIAPCLVLEDGSVFHGSIDMNPNNEILKSAFNDTKPSAPTSSARRNDSAPVVQNAATDTQTNAPKTVEKQGKTSA
ncbi:bactofilin family protein [Vreelandella sulfidaeris]|uniref:bactofilin family protein n=1 Tax=Vreelandella sulfidaeris TaxID=115553 RepID=UPI0035ED5BC3